MVKVFRTAMQQIHLKLYITNLLHVTSSGRRKIMTFVNSSRKRKPNFTSCFRSGKARTRSLLTSLWRTRTPAVVDVHVRCSTSTRARLLSIPPHVRSNRARPRISTVRSPADGGGARGGRPRSPANPGGWPRRCRRGRRLRVGGRGGADERDVGAAHDGVPGRRLRLRPRPAPKGCASCTLLNSIAPARFSPLVSLSCVDLLPWSGFLLPGHDLRRR